MLAICTAPPASYLEATECEKELALARIADIFGLNNYYGRPM